MGTANFYNHENGIFVIADMGYDEALESIKANRDESEKDEEITETQVYNEINFYNQINYEEFFEYQLKDILEENGMELDIDSQDKATVYRNNKIMAELTMNGGYYSGVQIIVETDVEELLGDDSYMYYSERTEDYEDEMLKVRIDERYTKHNKTLFKIMNQYTESYGVTGVFSNGNAIYHKVS